jgi:quercetin dioxygenase-like cupin family protein
METVVLQGELNKAGPYTVRIKLPSHYLVAPHTHPSVEALTVISGTMYLGMSDKFDQNKVIALPAGTFILVPAMAPHFVFSKNEGLITQVNADGPRKMDFIAGGPQSGPMKK